MRSWGYKIILKYFAPISKNPIKYLSCAFTLAAQEEFVARGLTICIYPPTLKNANVTWDDLCNYLKLQCCFAAENEKRRKQSVVSSFPIE